MATIVSYAINCQTFAISELAEDARSTKLLR